MNNLKKKAALAIVLCLLFALVACTGKSSESSSDILSDISTNVNSSDVNYNYIGSTYFDPDARKYSVAYQNDIVIDKDTAIEYANLIMTNVLKKDVKNYKLVYIGLDTNSDVWVINYCIDEETVGGCIGIALSKKTGEVIKVWFGE